MSAYCIPRAWRGQVAAIFGSGPSMTPDVAASVRSSGARVIAINSNALDLAPWADVLYAPDFKWWDHYREQVQHFKGLKLAYRSDQGIEGVHFLYQSREIAFDPQPTHLVSGGNAGYQALCIAVHFGASRIVLCGFDMRAVGGKYRNREYPDAMNAPGRFGVWINRFNALAPLLTFVDVVNATPGSALQCFRRMRLQDALAPAPCMESNCA